MSSIEVWRNYQHDIVGKFRDIDAAVKALEASSFEDQTNNEIFHAIHEVLLKMLWTSRETMLANLKQQITLQVSEQKADSKLPKLLIEGLTVRYKLSPQEMTYYYFTEENPGPVEVGLSKLSMLLPFREISRMNT